MARGMLVYSYDIRLVLASVAISLMAAFTGLSLARGLSALPPGPRKARIAMAAVALGTGIWSMHFVAMLAMRFEGAVVQYRAVETAASAMLAMLLAGLALLVLHFGRRTRARLVLAGMLLGGGIVGMHYLGLSGIEGCIPVYDPAGIAVAAALAAVLGIGAVVLAYGERSDRRVILATLVFGIAVAAVHFAAMHWTGFAPLPGAALPVQGIGNEALALVVLVSCFIIMSAFLLTGASFVTPEESLAARPASAAAAPRVATTGQEPSGPDQPPVVGERLPFERDGTIYFVPAAEVAAVRAEGHYSILYTREGRLFCPWSITEAERRLGPGTLMRVHRSYLVNPAHVVGFARRKDNGLCLFDGGVHIERVPVSRTHIVGLRARLGI